jgi:hypothetical protein
MTRLTMIENPIGIGVVHRGDTYIKDVRFRIDNSAVTVDTVHVQVTYPCESGTTDFYLLPVEGELGRYVGDWCIDSDATYGEYNIEVAVLDNNGNTSIFESIFYILPKNLVPRIRSISGIKQSSDVDDRDIAMIAWNAFIESLDDVFFRVIEERVRGGRCDNTYYTNRRHLVDDVDYCEWTDVQVLYRDPCGRIREGSATIIDATTGEIQIFDADGDTLNPCICDTRINYTIRSRTWSETLHLKAIAYLAAHEVILRFNELDKATLADLHSNTPIILAHPDRMLKEYKRIINKIRITVVDGI